MTLKHLLMFLKGDHWVRDEESKSWHRHHVDARQAFFGDDRSSLPPGGPSQADVDDFRVTHLKYIDSTKQCIRDDRRILNPGHRVRTQRFWTGVTILYDKGHAPSRAPRVTLAKFKDRLDKVKDLDAGESKAHTLHGYELDYEQKEERKERSYSGSGKPNSISSIQAEPPPKRGDSVPDVAGGDNPQPGDSTPSLSTDASMGMASHPEASKSVGQDAQPEPADAGGAKRASPSQGAAGGENDGDGNGAEGDSPTSPVDELPGRDDPMDVSGTGGGGVDPIHLTMTTIRLIPGTMNLARTRNIMRPLKVRMLASLCITCSGEQVIRQRWRHGGTGPGLGAFFTPIRLTLSRMPLLFLCGRARRRISFSRCWTMLRQMIVASVNTTGISCLRPFCLIR